MTPFDHLLTLVLVLLSPAYVAWETPRLARRIAADPLNARTRFYVWGMGSQWALTFAMLGAWWWTGRPMQEIGLQLPGSASAWSWSLLIVLGGLALFCQQGWSVLRSPEAQAKVREHLESQPGIRTILPATPREARLFIAVAITAGICEEALYRGYLLWYFRAFVPGGLAVAAAVLVFGVGHAYQGVRGVLSTTAAGAIAMSVYLLTGSLLAPIVLHAALDLVNGFTLYRALRQEAPPPERESGSRPI